MRNTSVTRPAAVALTALALHLAAAAVPAAVSIPVQNHTFVNAANFDFRNDPGNLTITAANVNKWVSRQANEDNEMDIANITASPFVGANTYLQDGSTSMVFQANNLRGLAMLIDVSAYDMTAGALTLSAIFSSRAANHSGILRMRGYNDLTGLTVDLGGDWSFTGGTAAFDYGTTNVPNSEIQATSIVKTLSGTSSVDFNWLVILLGGRATAADSDSDWVAIDNVQLSLEQPTTPIPAPAALSAGIVLMTLAAAQRRRASR